MVGDMEVTIRRCHYCCIEAKVQEDDPMCPNCGYTGHCYECGDPIDILLADPCFCQRHIEPPETLVDDVI